MPYGLDHEATPAQCAKAGGRMLNALAVHGARVVGAGLRDDEADGGVFGEVNPKLACADGSYYQLPVDEWASHPLNVCKAQ